jgi:hypothetical protein
MAFLLSACYTTYVDGSLKDIPPERFQHAGQAQPVQLLYEFQTRGASNSQATALTKEGVAEVVRRTGLFSPVGTEPVAGGAVLNIIINNVPVGDDAAAKGFVTGFTFGVVGNQVTDAYLCTVDYLPRSNAQKISRTVRHAIHTTVGAKGAPENAVLAPSQAEAVKIMIRQAVSNALDALASDPGFRK